jgi:NAD-dependent dihydropyrimidine dehydrogenase PreA subunit
MKNKMFLDRIKRQKSCLTNMKECKYNVLGWVNGENGKHIVVQYLDKCTACGDCVDICKFHALELIQKNKCAK